MKAVAAMHEALPLFILVSVVALFVHAGREYANKVNAFVSHKTQTCLFAISMISLLSGIFLYLRIYWV